MNLAKNLWRLKMTSHTNPPAAPTGEATHLSSSDQQWFERLSGKLTEVTDQQALAEADLLRAAILSEQAAFSEAERSSEFSSENKQAELSTSAEQAGTERLMFALRREGLLPNTNEAAKNEARTQATRPRWMMPSALAASVLVGFFALQALQIGQVSVQYDEPPTMRGQIQEITLKDKAPKAKAESVAGKLKEAGLSARIYQSQEKFMVDTDLVPEKLEAAAKVLAELGVELKPGQARIYILK